MPRVASSKMKYASPTKIHQGGPRRGGKVKGRVPHGGIRDTTEIPSRQTAGMGREKAQNDIRPKWHMLKQPTVWILACRIQPNPATRTLTGAMEEALFPKVYRYPFSRVNGRAAPKTSAPHRPTITSGQQQPRQRNTKMILAATDGPPKRRHSQPPKREVLTTTDLSSPTPARVPTTTHFHNQRRSIRKL